MSYKDDFAAANNETGGVFFEKNNSVELSVICRSSRFANSNYIYNFLTRILCHSFGNTTNAIPFAQLDREVLEAMHAKLVHLRGTPPALASIDSPHSRPIAIPKPNPAK